MNKQKIDNRIIDITSIILSSESSSDEQRALVEELKLLQNLSKCWQIVESTHIPDGNLLTRLSELTHIIVEQREESFYANPYFEESKTLVEIFKTWIEADIINSNIDYEIDDGSERKRLQETANILRGSLYEFFKFFWNIVAHNTLVDNFHIKYLCDELQIIGDCLINDKTAPYSLVINIPPATSKSTICSVMFPAWLWTNRPSIRIISSSHTADLSTRDSVLTRDILVSNKYRQLFPEVQLRHDSSAKSNYKNTAGGFRMSSSTNSQPTGYHADIKILDDVLGKIQAQSEADRAAAIRHVEALATRDVSPEKLTPVLMVQQRLHPLDTTAYFLGLGLPVKHICLPAIDSELVKPIELRNHYIDGLLDPVRLSRTVLERRKLELGADGFAGEYEQNPILAAGLLYEEFRTYEIIPREEYMYRYCTIDTADLGKDDLCAIIADDRVSGVYLIDVFVSDKSSEYTIPIIANMLTKYKVDEVKIEKNAAGRLYSVELERQLRLRQNFTTKVRTFWSKENKETRIYINAPEIQNNTWMPVGWKSMWPEFSNQITNRQKAGIHSKDDCVDNLTNLHLFRPFKRQKSINADNFKATFSLL